MKIELEIKQKEFVDKIAEWYAQLLFEKRDEESFMFGFQRDVGDALRKHALKIIGNNEAYADKIKKLLRDDAFIRKVVSEMLQEKADELLEDMKI